MGGVKFSRGALYAILKNPAYIGKISHKGKIYEGLHEGIITYHRICYKVATTPMEQWHDYRHTKLKHL